MRGRERGRKMKGRRSGKWGEKGGGNGEEEEERRRAFKGYHLLCRCLVSRLCARQ
jgi:hypothetical protein